ncbi:MAG: hypothetical protein WAO83_14990, partial [Fuerstiella sp.]
YVGFQEDGETPAPLEVEAYVKNSSITTSGDLNLWAQLNSTIESTVVSAAVAYSSTPIAGGVGSGAGASSENIVNSKVRAYLDGDAENSAYVSTGVIRAENIDLHAKDQSTITAFTGAAALAASVGQSSIAVTIGTGLAWNTISNDVSAYVANIDQDSSPISNNLTVLAESDAVITAHAWAASISATSGAAGLSISGAGADALNVIRGNVDAYILDSHLVVEGDVSVKSTQSSEIDSTIWAAAGSFSASASTSLGLAIGTATASNYVGFSDDGEQIEAFRVSAYVKNSALDVLGNLALLADMSAVIDATVAAGSVAVSGGSLSGNVAAAGSGVENKISTQVQAYLDGTSGDSSFERSEGIHAGAISLDAHDNSSITAWAGTASIAGSFGTVSGAVTIAAATAFNTISNEVGTFISGYSTIAGKPGVSTEVTLNSLQEELVILKPGTRVKIVGENSTSVFEYRGPVSSASVNLKNQDYGDQTSWTEVLAENAVNWQHVISNAYVEVDGLTLYKYLGEEATFDLNSQDYMNAELWSVVTDENPDNPLIALTGPKLNISLTATENANVNADAAAAGLAVSFGAADSFAVSGAGAHAENRIIGRDGIQNVSSYIASSSVHSAGDLDLVAEDTSTITANIISAAASAAAAGAFAASAAIGSSTASNYIGSIDPDSVDRLKVKAGIESLSDISVSQSIHVLATESVTNTANVDSFAVALAIGSAAISAAGAGVEIHNIVGANVSAKIEGQSTVHVTSGDVEIQAKDTTNAKGQGLASSISASAGAFAGAASVGVALSYVEVANRVEAGIDLSTITLDKGDLTLQAKDSATLNSSSEAAAIAAGFSIFAPSVSVSGGGAQADAIAGGNTEASITNSTVTLPIGNLIVSATQDVNVDSTSGSKSITSGLNSLAAGGSIANVELKPDIKALLTNSTVTASGITVSSVTTPTGLAEANGLSAGPGAAVGVSEAEVILTPQVKSTAGGSGIINADSLLVESRTNLYEHPDTPRKSAKAEAIGSAGALIGTTSTHANVQTGGSVTSKILPMSNLTVRETTVSADSFATNEAIADSYAGGALAIGVSKAIAKSTMEVGAEVGDGTHVDGGTLGIYSQRVHDQLSDTLAGAGGLGIAGASASAETSQSGDVTAILGNQTTIVLTDVFQQSSTADTTLNGSVVSYAGGILSGGGAYIDNNHQSHVSSTVGEDAQITASSIEIGAGNVFRKPEVDDNILGATGGLVSGASATSSTILDMTTDVVIKTNASLDVVGSESNEDLLILRALNTIDAHDTVTFATGGAISGARADSEIKSTQDRATITLGENSELKSVGRVVISARGNGTVTTKTNEDVFGLGTVGVSNAISELKPVNEINIETGANVIGAGDLLISAGTDTNFNRDSYTISAVTDVLAGSLIAINVIDSQATLEQTNKITVADGATLQSAGDIKLHAEKDGFADMFSKAKAVTWMSEIADAVDEANNDAVGATPLAQQAQEQYSGTIT